MRLGLTWVCVAVWALSGCTAKDPERARPIGEDCEGMEFCGDQGGGLTGGIGAMGQIPVPVEDAGMGGGGATAGDASPGTLQGTVDTLSGSDLKTAQALDADVEISAPGTAGVRVSARYDGNGDFTLVDAEISANLWIAVSPLVSSEQQLMHTLQRVDTTSTGLLTLYVADRLSMEAIAAEGSLLTPIELEDTKGHALIYFVDAEGDPVDQVTLLETAATSEAVIAYGGGDVFSDALPDTEVAGSVMLLNVNAAAFPGALNTFVFSYEGQETSFDIQMARDTLSLAVITVN
jgi:hypothetical protein